MAVTGREAAAPGAAVGSGRGRPGDGITPDQARVRDGAACRRERGRGRRGEQGRHGPVLVPEPGHNPRAGQAHRPVRQGQGPSPVEADDMAARAAGSAEHQADQGSGQADGRRSDRERRADRSRTAGRVGTAGRPGRTASAIAGPPRRPGPRRRPPGGPAHRRVRQGPCRADRGRRGAATARGMVDSRAAVRSWPGPAGRRDRGDGHRGRRHGGERVRRYPG